MFFKLFFSFFIKFYWRGYDFIMVEYYIDFIN